MRMNDLIRKKRDGLALGADEIRDMIASYTCGDIPDYQMSAMMMAIYFNGMNRDETLALTLAMRDSGDTLDLSGISGIKVDKHSTGGVGDKTSIALAPLVAAAGAKVAKMSGRGLGHTGGTIDKLECFPGFSTELSEKAFIDQVNKTGLAIMGQTKDLAPADKKLYALRDVTATVEQISLIASSVMSKKLACGADGIVLDVKCGSGAFMKDISSARALAREMTEIGKGAGKKMRALITDMDEPLGYAVGNILEVKEAIETLKGKGPEDFTKLCLLLGSRMLMLSGICDDEDKASELLMKKIEDGSALEKLADFVKAQGGDERYVYEPDRFKEAEKVTELKAWDNGYIEKIICDEAGFSSMLLGAGRAKKEDKIDSCAGIVFEKKKGDEVKTGDVIARLYHGSAVGAGASLARLKAAVTIGTDKVPDKKILIDEIE
ncbi:MAG: thymidine phosphorylase [Lachnospiraceae bacterium]|nr:thymidine phosphorylase [Lachnospiraceae bacterium]